MQGGVNGKLLLNPKDSEVVAAGSQLVFVTSDLAVDRADGVIQVRG